MSEIPDGIAIIGLSGRFPKADTPDAFWENLVHGVDAISRFREEELERHNRPRGDSGNGYVAARGILENASHFDAGFFGISRQEAEWMDPQHRVFLECAWEALESAGCDPGAFPGLIGVFAGCSLNTYFLNNICSHPGYASRFAGLLQAGEYAAYVGGDKDFLPTRVSYRLNLRGPSLAIQTACSSSLVAVSQACDSLMAWQCDVALAGGVSITFPQKRDYPATEDGMMSEDGFCRAFDARACGTVFGHGAGVVVLKRLSDAIENRDNILTVIRGTAVNNDGAAKVGFAAPSVEGQAAVISMAQAAAGVTPEEVSYIEAHGTGTPLGDPIEFAGLVKAFRDGGATEKHFCHLGSAKPFIGHLDAAAGVVGLIKTVLQLERETIPPLLHFETPNPRLDLESSPFVPVRTCLPWKRGEHPRIAGVTSLGVGGTNVHVVVSEAPSGPEREIPPIPHILPLSAKSPAALNAMAENLARHLEKHPRLKIADVAFTLQQGRRAFPYRRAIVAASGAEAVEALRKPASAPRPAVDSPEVVFVFPGQGAQVPGMAGGLAADEPVFRAALEECEAILQRLTGEDWSSILRPGPDLASATRALTFTSRAQPALFAVEYALARLWEHWGIAPSALIGHSVGEYVAAVLSCYWTLETALEILCLRSRLQENLPGGGMLAVRLDETELQKHLVPGIEIAALNSPRLTTVAGPVEAVARLAAVLETESVPHQALGTSHAFHSAMMDPMLEAFERGVKNHPGRPLSCAWISTLTGEFFDAENPPDANYWSRQVREPVRFSAAVGQIVGKSETFFLEVGPGRALAAFVMQHPARMTGVDAASSLPEPCGGRADMLAALGAFWERGGRPNWTACRREVDVRRTALPTYPFERECYWIEPAAAPEDAVQPDVSVSREAVAETPEPEPAARPMLEDVRDFLQNLSGIPMEDPARPFAEYGLDSLFLTQLGLAIQKEFGVAVTFRQLLRELATVQAVADYLESRAIRRPSGKFVPVSPTAGVAGMRSKKPVIAWPGANPPGGRSTRFGPFKPVEKGEGGKWPPKQQEALERWIARYTAKTPGSKRSTARSREHFADPRTVAGFHLRWKEMVYPIVAVGSKGSKIRDVDGNEFIDVTMGFGAYFFGHSPDFVVDAVQKQLESGMEIGPQNALAGDVAREICALSGLDRATFCNTGSEAVMAAIRLARTATGRSRIVFFSGDYHGLFDEVLVRGSWPGGNYEPVAAAPGIPPELVENVLVLEYGDPASLEILRANAGEIAAVLVEPVQGRNPGLQPRDFLHRLRRVCSENDVPLVFDEVVTGFRCHPGGAQAYFGVAADLAVYGKVIGGGLPVGILAGRARFMDALDGGNWRYGDDSGPETGMTFFAGTFVRHPLAMAAMSAVLRHLHEAGPGLQLRVTERVSRLMRVLNDDFVKAGVPLHFTHFSSWGWLEHGADPESVSLLWYLLRERGIHWWEGRPMHLTAAHTDEDMDRIITAFRAAVAEMQEAGFLPGKVVPAGACSGTFPRGDSAPTTEAEREVLLAAAMGDAANCAYNEAAVLEFRGDLDVDVLRRALGHLVERHAALRSRFSADAAAQFFDDIPEGGIAFDLLIEDLSRESAESAAGKLAQWCSHETSTPFDLLAGPLIRARLIRLAADNHRLLFTAHHVVCDGWSFGMLVSELGEIATALAAGRIPLLPPPFPFSHFARTSAASLAAGESSAAERFWVEKFQYPPPPLELPVQKARGATRAYDGAMVVRRLSATTVTQLRAAAARDGVTMFSLTLAAFVILLRRLSHQTDFVIGVPAAGQLAAGEERLIGHCLNFLPLRIRAAGGDALSTVVDTVAREVLLAMEHQSVTLGTILHQLRMPRDPARNALVPVMFNIDRSGLESVGFPDVTFEMNTNPKQFVNFELFFNLVQTGDRLDVECEFRADLFEAPVIEAWLEGYEEILNAICESPAAMVDAVPIVRRPPAPSDACTTHCERPSTGNVAAWFFRTAETVASRPALVVGETSRTYAELAAAVGQLSGQLIEAGVGIGEKIGLSVSRSEALPVGLLGALAAGAAWVPLDPSLPLARLNEIARAAGLRCVIADSTAPDFPGLRRFDAERVWSDSQPGHRAARSVPPDSPAYVMFTSGSTGQPKGVVISHGALENFLHAMRNEPGFSERDVLLAVTTFTFDISILEILLPLVSGARLVIAGHDVARDPLLLAAEIDRRGVSVLQATPTTWQMLLESGWSGRPELRAFIGGEAVSRDLANRLAAVCGEVWNLYGPTEATIWCAAERLQVESGPVLIGRPIANTVLHVVNDRLQWQLPGVPGELLIGGSGLAAGYLENPDLTARQFFAWRPDERVYRSGDLARLLPDGRIECLGRSDHQIKLRGFRIEPGEIEAVLKQHPAVLQAVVVLRTPADRTPYLAAVIRSESEPADLAEFLAASLPDYMVPSRFEFVGEYPMTVNGKIDRKVLAASAPTEESLAPGRPRVPGATPVEAKLLELWARQLGNTVLGVTDDVFEHGADSLLVLRMTIEAGAEGLNFRPLDVFRHRTIRRLAAALSETSVESVSRSTPSSPAAFEILPVRAGNGIPVFVFHGDWIGEGGYVVNLAGMLPDRGPVFSVSPYRFSPDAEPDLRKAAVDYARAISETVSSGPVVLCGYCIGGWLAVETAEVLRSVGCDIARLIVLDPPEPQAPWVVRAWHLAGGFSAGDERCLKRMDRLTGMDRRLRYPLRRKVERLLEKLGLRPEVSGAVSEDEVLPVGDQAFALYMLAGSLYQSSPKNIPVLLLKPGDSMDDEYRESFEAYFSGNLEVRQVRGDHTSCIREHLDSAAAEIARELERISPKTSR